MAEALYTTEILRLATQTANWPRLALPDVSVERRAPLCGSSLALDIEFDGNGRIVTVGMRPQACAFGQAAASLFANGARGQDATSITAAHGALREWLAGRSDLLPDWPGIEAVTPARAHSARHGAILLPFAAALDAMAKAEQRIGG